MQGGVGAAGGGAGAAAAGPTPQQTNAMHFIDNLWGAPGGAALGDDGKRVLEDLFGTWFWKNFRSERSTRAHPSLLLHMRPFPDCMPLFFLLHRS